MATKTLDFAEIVGKAKKGEYKLPAFQRGWKWQVRQVKLLYESLRLGYPIGSFLVMTSEESEKLAPRAFFGTGKKAAENQTLECLVLDGQQRITSGINLYYGLEDVSGAAEYYIDINSIKRKMNFLKLNIEDEDAVKEFSLKLDVIEDSYIINRPKKADRKDNFFKDNHIWTGFLTEDRQEDFDEMIENCQSEYDKKVLRKLVRKYLKPKINIQVPVIELGQEFGLSAISRVFTTINTTGKLLTPFELVVAILYPYDINLSDTIKELKKRYKYYSNMDKNGEILLQTIALLSGKSPKKSDLPKNIDKNNYTQFLNDAVNSLNRLGEYLTDKLGMGLDVTDKLIPYDAIFAPMALVLDYINDNVSNHTENSEAKRKIDIWFISSVLNQRYQEGVHTKQTKDKDDVVKWVVDKHLIPQWITDTYISPSIKRASTAGAIGKMLMCLINREGVRDPVTDKKIGFKDGVYSAEFHHIYPTKWVSKGLTDYKVGLDVNLALNIMFLSKETNSDWLNFDPKDQIGQAIKAHDSNQVEVVKLFANQYIDEECIANLLKPVKTVGDFENFINLRYKTIVDVLKQYNIKEIDSAIDDSDYEDTLSNDNNNDL